MKELILLAIILLFAVSGYSQTRKSEYIFFASEMGYKGDKETLIRDASDVLVGLNFTESWMICNEKKYKITSAVKYLDRKMIFDIYDTDENSSASATYSYRGAKKGWLIEINYPNNCLYIYFIGKEI